MNINKNRVNESTNSKGKKISLIRTTLLQRMHMTPVERDRDDIDGPVQRSRYNHSLACQVIGSAAP